MTCGDFQTFPFVFFFPKSALKMRSAEIKIAIFARDNILFVKCRFL